MTNKSIDKWLDYTYKPKKFTCTDFTRLVWLELTGVDLSDALAGLLETQPGKGIQRRHRAAFRPLREPVDPCLVVMQRPRDPVHLGVHIRGRILHLREDGVAFQSIAEATQFHKSYRFALCVI